MRQLHILAEPRTPTASDPREWDIIGGDDGMSQIEAFAARLADEDTGQLRAAARDAGADAAAIAAIRLTRVHFEILWPWETTEDNTWDAVRIDLEAEPGPFRVMTLPPYAAMTATERAYYLGEDTDA